MDIIPMAEVAQMLGKSERSIARWVKAGIVPSVVLGCGRVIPRDVFDTWWKDKKAKALAAASEGE